MTGEEALALVREANEAVRLFDHLAYINRRHGLYQRADFVAYPSLAVDNPSPIFFDISNVLRPADRIFRIRGRKHPGPDRVSSSKEASTRRERP